MALFSFNNNTTLFKLPSSGEQTGQTGLPVQDGQIGHVKGSERATVRSAWYGARPTWWPAITVATA